MENNQKNHKQKIFLIGIGILIIFLLFMFLESLYPYNFSKGDNLVQFLPVLIEGLEQLFSGSIPSINLHQLMGSPILEVGTYAVLYPLMILSYVLSHYLFGNDFLLLEIFVLVHLILGFIATYFFLNSKIKNNLISFFASIAFVFSGYNIILASEWYYIIPTIFFLPLILLLNDKLIRGQRYMFLLGISRGIYFYSGNAQYFVYTLFFELAYMVLILYQNEWKNYQATILAYLKSMILSITLALPLLLSQISFIQGTTRGNVVFLEYLLSKVASLKGIILGSILTYPFVKLSPHIIGSSPSSFIDIYYSGALFSILFFLGGIYFLMRYKSNSLKEISPLFWLGLLSIILSLGIFGLIYSFGVFLPLIKNFRHPFKLTLFTNFFTILFGATFGNFIYKKNQFFKKNLKFFLILFSILIIFHLSISTQVIFTYYGDKLPLEKTYFENLNLEDQRIISIYTNSSLNPKLVSYSNSTNNFPESPLLSENYATYFDVDHISGREPFKDSLTEEKIPISESGLSDVRLNFTTLREYGVKYIFIPQDSLLSHLEITNLKLKYSDEVLTIYELENVKGYVFTGSENLDYLKLNNGFEFKTNFDKTKNVTINLLYKKNYVAKINGVKTKIFSDDFGRMFVTIPSGEEKVVLTYHPKEFIYGSFFSGLILIVFLYFHTKPKKIKFKLKKPKFPFQINWKKIILVLVLFVILLINFNFFNPPDIENLITQKTGINTDIGKISTNMFLGKIILQDVSLLDQDGKIFLESEKVLIDVNYFRSLKGIITLKNLNILFEKVLVNDLTIISSNKNSLDSQECSPKFNNYLTEETKLSQETIKIFSSEFKIDSFKVLSATSFSGNLNNMEFSVLNSNSDQKIVFNSELHIIKNRDPKYLKGVIYISEVDENREEKNLCFFLPKESENGLYFN